ncbi:BirA family biotin operon repressor/biotin-[acetyl-CoA-carboxylase] ligase [Aminivibrio pyruvatiphilus]|jgi:BirA family biotin operon repressor/biotin-[acetyl-CoA-carboxylase] ligase|uniref:Bifunctional ligase/repressor BirA n=1 Tax=Aminivibrio pyruvatiphilus TaxID=1005740 RepID=A0A4V3HGL5_9BACT|nr:biotin--[acetyl-CoA-carboxylase] ligase [Aminivibrio pyruvatiphilus]TDY61781.1 BirA family biotin operon repressor/biotin-[acetyl-CoA-carboxylase] ligase [Aminivibrio pyruvatiphilus]
MKSRRATVELCRLLRDSGGTVVSGGVVSQVLSLSRQAVWKAVRDLEEEGFSVASVPQKGYILRELPVYDLAPSLIGSMISPDCPWGGEIHVFESVSSTQEAAKRIGRQGETDGIVVIAEEQTKGRGRRDRTWVSPRGAGLYFSVFFRPRMLPGRLQLVNLAAGLAVREAIRSVCGREVSLKWPNDLLFRGRKICGILSEASSDPERIRDCCTGIGINISLSREDLAGGGLENAASLGWETGPVHRGALCAAVIEKFYLLIAGLSGDGGESLLSRYREECSTIGKNVTVLTEEESFAGRASGIGENGELLVENGKGSRSFCAADVVHATPEGKGL